MALSPVTFLTTIFDVGNDADIYVIHCASIVTVNPEYNPKVMEVNVGGTRNIIDACLECKGFRKLVYVGSTGAIPALPKGYIHREVGGFKPELLRDCYSRSKADASNLVLDAAKRGLDACIVMPTGIMGPGDSSVSKTTGTVIRYDSRHHKEMKKFTTVMLVLIWTCMAGKAQTSEADSTTITEIIMERQDSNINELEKIANGVKKGYLLIENGVVKGYKAIEAGAVKGFTMINDTITLKLFGKDGETIEETKARLKAGIEDPERHNGKVR